MTEMKRLLDHGATSFEAMLLGQAAEEQPNDARLARMLAVMPSAGGAMGVPAIHSTTAAAGRNAAGTAGTTGLSGLIWAGFGLAVGGVMLAGFWMTQPADGLGVDAPPVKTTTSEVRSPDARQADESKSVSMRVVETEGALALSPKVSSREVTSEQPRSGAEARTITKGSVRGTPGAVAGPVSTPENPSSLREEISLLENVRTQIARGDKSAALAGLHRYRSQFPQGVLAAEALVLNSRAQKLTPGE